MAAPPIGSLLVGSSNVETMKDWYRRAFDVKENDMGAFEFGPARVIINLDVEDCRAIESHLEQLGVRWVRKVEQMPFGLIGTVADPDGNYVQIIQWGASPEAHKEA
jgi:predicted enzyme related to lactoylglutathione lyase